MKRSKNYLKQAKNIEEKKLYNIEDAIELVKNTSKTKFDGSVEVHIRLGINTKQSEQQIRSTTTLPYGTGKTIKVAVFAQGDKQKEAKEAGADIVGGNELIEEIQKSGKCDFSVAVATPDIMKDLARIAKVLGPRGLMPSPKNETVTIDVKKAVEELKKGKITLKNDDTGNLHQIIGKTSFKKEHLVENFNALIEAVKKNRPAKVRGNFIKNVSISSTMGPGIKVAVE